MRSFISSRHTQTHFARCLALLLLAQAFPIQHANAAPSQRPLLSQSKLNPAPNVMLTLDDSGSMTYQYLPERSFKLNGYDVDFPNDGKIFLHPRELESNRFTFKDSDHKDNRFVTAAPQKQLTNGMLLLQAQMRSPQVNRLYYNPYIKYSVWKKADGTDYGGKVDPATAWLHPSLLESSTLPTGPEFVDLTSTTASHLARWYCRDASDWSECAGDSAYETLDYRPALVYMLSAGSNPNTLGNYTEYDLNAITSVSWPEDLASSRTDCARQGDQRVCTKAAELKNFATWFIFYRSRLFVAQGQIPAALANSSGEIRLGWGTIHPRQTFEKGAEVWTTFNPDSDITTSEIAKSFSVQQGVRDLNAKQLGDFTKWLRTLKTERRTPTLHAMYSVGEYFRRDGDLNPYQNDMSKVEGDGSTALACRRSYHLMVTDGYYHTEEDLNNNGDNMFAAAGMSGKDALPKIGNVDADNLAKIPGSRDKEGDLRTAGVFTDGLGDTLADHAMRLWLPDLQPKLADQVEPIDLKDPKSTTPTSPDELVKEVRSDPATWQHLTHLMVGFGVKGDLDSENATATIKRLIDNKGTTWPNPLNRIDDLWHAALNSRGEYFSASNPEELKKALEDALSSGNPGTQMEAGLATASSVLEAGNIKYVPEYQAKGWTGDIVAWELDAKGEVAKKEPEWRASDRLPAPNDRNIVVWQSNGATNFKADNFSALDATTRAALGDSEAAQKALINFTRGSDDSDLFRKHPGKLPDFINSTPLLVKGGQNLGYGSTSMTGASSYSGNGSASDTSYLTTKRLARRNGGLLFIGGNGGMLHAFDARQKKDEGGGGEVFAFVPQAALPKLLPIASPRYGRPDVEHQFVVDGQLTESDVYINDDWHNIVVGAMGAGGKSVFAIHVPTSSPASLGATNVMWEATHSDMGYVTSAAQVGLTPQGWKVFVGNGVDSASNRSALLVIDVRDGSVQSIRVGSDNETAAQHGLGGVTLVKDPGTGMVKAAYAGDTRGRLWRFDVTTEGVYTAYDGKPMFTATNPASAHDGASVAQPISAAPLIKNNPKGGQVVVVNTGKLLYTSDASNAQTQSAYGIWEAASALTPTKTGDKWLDSPGLTRDRLVLQTIDTKVIKDTAGIFYNTSKKTVDGSANARGWILDLAIPPFNPSEPFTYPKALYEPLPIGNTNATLITAVKPGATEVSCEKTTAEGYYFILDAISGARPLSLTLNTGSDTQNKNTSGGRFEGGGAQRVLTDGHYDDGGGDPPPPKKDCLNFSRQYSLGQGGGSLCPNKRINDRVWRQLLNPPAP